MSQELEKSKEFKVCSFGKIELKEDDKDFYVHGYVATSHPDRASADGYDGDILAKSALIKIVEQINNRSKPEAGAVSESHDWIKDNDSSMPLAGVTCEPAVLEQLTDNEWGVKVGTVLARTNPRKDEVKNNIEQGIYPGFSIEYDDPKYIPTTKEGKMYRLITDLNMRGFGFANRRLIANPNAQITDFGYKEMVTIPSQFENTKIKQTGETMENEQMVKFKEMEVKLAQIEAKEAQAKADLQMKEAIAAQVKEVLAKEAPMLNVGKDKTATQAKSIKFKEVKDNPYVKAQARMKELDMPMKSNNERIVLHNEIIKMQYKEAARVCNEMVAAGIPVYQNWHMMHQSGALEMKQSKLLMNEVGNRIEIKETELHNIQMKALDYGRGSPTGGGLHSFDSAADSNLADESWTFGSMYQSPVELNDIYGQAIVNQLNDQTTTWGKLRKEDWSGRSQIQFRARTGRNTTAAGYAEGANLTYATSFTGAVGRMKFQQPYSYYRVLVAVTGQELQFSKAPGGIGDIWADEIMWSTADLQVALNTAIIGTGDGSSESACLGFEGMILGTTGTLYARDIANYTTLKSHKESCSGRIDLDQLRKMIRYCEAGNMSTITNSNANRNDLAFFCNHLQRDFIYSLIQDMQRTVPTSARIGYEGVLEIDGVPIFADKWMNTDDLFLIDTANTAIAINLPPTIEPLPVTADAKAAQIKLYFNLYSKAPSNNYWSYGFATS